MHHIGGLQGQTHPVTPIDAQDRRIKGELIRSQRDLVRYRRSREWQRDQQNRQTQGHKWEQVK